MLEADKQELYRLVLDHMEKHGQSLTEMRIYAAHNGNPDGDFVTQSNLHLFRQFRNTVSMAPRTLVHAALESSDRFNEVFPHPDKSYGYPKKVR